MSDTLPPVQIKSEPQDKDSIESNFPLFRISTNSNKLDFVVEVIDLTEDDYIKEFKGFLDTLPKDTKDNDARIYKSKTKSNAVTFVLGTTADYLGSIRLQQDTYICELLGIEFKNVMLYGKLISEIIKDDYRIYELDDGTARVNIYFRQANKKYIDNLNKLNYCEDLLRRKPSPLNDESIPDSAELRRHLRLLILMAKKQCGKRLKCWKPRSRYFVIGSPFIGRNGKMHVFARSIFPDGAVGQSCELFWKSYLISFYEPLIHKTVGPISMNDTLRTLIDEITERLNTE